MALSRLGYTPTVPIDADAFSDRDLRQRWFEEKNIRVLQFWSDNHPETPVDVFVREPFEFEREYERGLIKELTGAGPVRFVALRKLVADAQHAAVAIEHGCTLVSTDSDFDRFASLRWRHPLRLSPR